MRILILSNLYPPNVIGGYERLCFEVASRLAAMGHEIIVLTSRYGGKRAEFAGQRILRQFDLLTGPDIYTPFPGTAENRKAIIRSNRATFERIMAEERPDVVFAWNLFFLDASLLDALEAGPVGVVLMLTDNWLLVMRNPVFVRDYFAEAVHGGKPTASPPRPGIWRRLIELGRRLLGGDPASKLDAIFGSAFMRDLHIEGGVRFGRECIIHNGVTLGADPLRIADRATLVMPGTLRLLFAGRLVDLKGAHTAVAAIPLLQAAALGVGRIELTLVGDAQDSAYMAVLHEAIAQSGAGPSIALLPSVAEDQLPALFNDHDLYLFPSLYEPFSLTLIHALGSGIPTIASRAGGNTEIVADGVSGLLFDKGDPAALAACICRLATDPALRARIAAQGRQTARQFTFERMVNEMAAFLSAAR